MDDVLNIEKLDYFGNGIAKKDGQVIFVKNALPGEEVSVKVVKSKKKFKEAEVVKIIKKSNSRVSDICPFSKKCGGCDIIHLEYNKALEFKEGTIREIFAKNFNYDIKINKIKPTLKEGYRNKITLHVKNRILGLYEEKSNRIVPIDKCLIVSDAINALIPRLNEFVKRRNVFLEYIIIKANVKGNVLLSLYGKVNKKDILDFFDDLDNIYINNRLVKGKGYIKETIGEYVFNISNKSFFQVNTKGAEILYNEVIRLMSKDNYDSILDLFCGTGTISMLVSSRAKKVIGIDSEKDAIKDAVRNAELNNISNISFVNAKVEDKVEEFLDIDLIIVDPPREGIVKDAVSDILKMEPKIIVYVSCNPITLVRDLKLLDGKYDILEVSIVDMFSNTHHVECVVMLRLKKNKETE